MIRLFALTLTLWIPLLWQNAPPAKPGWQERLEKASATPQAWKARRDEVRRQILVAAGLWPEYDRPALKPEVFGKAEADDYTIERVVLETLPGLHLSGSLYRPKGKAGPFPAILSPHGHWKEGRFTQEKDGNLPARGITFARLGFVCFMYDMVGFGDFKQLPHRFDDPAWGNGLFGLQTWNSLRAVDFVSGLPDVDPKRIGCTGASGGGTQTFILTAIDERIACAAPVNMVAAEFQGGCTCENAPYLRLGLNNVEIAAMTAPRPLLLIAATGDWTKSVPVLEGPVIAKTFESLGAQEKFKAVQFTAPHNYNQDSRETVYAWMVRWLQNGPDQPRLPEPPVPPVQRGELTVWTDDHKLPANAVDVERLRTLLRDRVTAQLASLQPKDGASLKRYRDLLEPAWKTLLPMSPPQVHERGPIPGNARTTIIVANRLEDIEPYSSAAAKAGDLVMMHALIPGFMVHNPEPPAGGDATQRKSFPDTFYRTEIARQVQDILNSIAQAYAASPSTQVRLVGLGKGSLPVLLARVVAGPSSRVALTIVDLSSVDSAAEAAPLPGLNRLGGWAGAVKLAPPGLLMLHGGEPDVDAIRAAYKAAGRENAVTISAEVWSRDRIVGELAR